MFCSKRRKQSCLQVVKKYNQYMQGVDRHDNLRERFSIAKGSSFKKWYRKLGFALVDIAISNVYVLWCKCDEKNRRDAHMHFHQRLSIQMMFDTDWNRYLDIVFIVYFIVYSHSNDTCTLAFQTTLQFHSRMRPCRTTSRKTTQICHQPVPEHPSTPVRLRLPHAAA